MVLEVLLSCMHQTDASIIAHTNVRSDILVVNQCDKNGYESYELTDGYQARMFYTTERGLSKSRNMAIYNAKGDICLICDDDEVLEDNYIETIISAFTKYPEADILTFNVNIPGKPFPRGERLIGYIGAMRTSSVQIAFRRKSIVDNNIRFDEKMGSGTGNGSGEEIKFLFDCLKKGLKIRYIPQLIASVAQTDSKWFKGFTNIYFLNRGYSNRRLLGLPISWLYSVYFAVKKYKEYQADNTFWNALYYQLKGTIKKR